MEPTLSFSQEAQERIDYETEWGHEVYIAFDGPHWMIRNDAPSFEEWEAHRNKKSLTSPLDMV